MLFDLPETDVLYEALLNRDPAYDGRAYVGVRSTGVFCRLTCPARKPKLENCCFFETIGDCFDAGFRPCKRCHPVGTSADNDETVKTLLTCLEERPNYKWTESEIVRLGFEPSTVRRSFKRQFGITFLEMARQSRLRDGFEILSEGGRVIDAQLASGFSSPGAFREAFAKLLGCAPGELKQDGYLKADWFDTPLGAMIAVSDKSSLHLLEFADRKALPTELSRLRKQVKGDLGLGRTQPTDQMETELHEFFDGKRLDFEVPLALHGTEFTKDVWRELRRIPVGETRSYSELAKLLGNPNSTRAVARANGANQIAVVIPCHRVVGLDGSLTGYGGGLWRKQKLIDLELKIAKARGNY
ncbi:Bifunctional transcriptional activator/DNA repair enzyme Ada [Pseudovibrio axinellae]|uniref:methylated-DNA--[protein]-cysteine S-methyltransferase n=1 Tax=Pseudovibrio axinellae TaxID=989403 RepID=A0A165YAS3_9HYPH|nr:trifunctional transcriptional activator/DNA repair protein Ada/methylated-DNA--[protein]-cysteine S-methyltransferase [Pseudovibrio axinellae]KZL18620.1 Bifunctional transcriptional activator/DNA repair enzyme Ada [Pseudovibrio axinellae]SER74239.1 DNA-O6-methylguanine--protein-cysteine S-methyltransferase /Transcriptional regulator Ada [Pseudovibrio axinellae]